jgi:hypothetical protein
VYRRWVSHWSFGYAVQPRTPEGAGATFLAMNASLGPRFAIDGALIAAIVGVQVQQIEATLGEADLGRKRPAVGPSMALHVRLINSQFAPFLEARASYLPPTPFLLEDVDATGATVPGSTRELGRIGPWQVEALVGASFAFTP